MTIIDAVMVRLNEWFAGVNAASPVADRISVYDGDVPPTPTSRYAVMWAFAPRLDALTVDGEFRDLSGSFQVTGVGPTRAITERILLETLKALSGWTPTVAGLHCHPIEPNEDSEVRVDRDDSVADRKVQFGFVQFRWAAELPI